MYEVVGGSGWPIGVKFAFRRALAPPGRTPVGAADGGEDRGGLRDVVPADLMAGARRGLRHSAAY
ncbi:hypothetical protein AB0E67_14870 [Streptomyces sp. NPDC032161]|uniref:hypothetical protein n=1 Tax=unclassified Streptomyces TaxID=2593676 RepID=UPI00340AEDB3